MFCVYDSSDIIEETWHVPVACFDDFFDASDYVGEHPESSLYIVAGDPFVPVLTNEDLDAYVNHPAAPGGVDPRGEWDVFELPYVLMFLGWAAQLKAMSLPQSDPGHFGYETMLYNYHKVAESI